MTKIERAWKIVGWTAFAVLLAWGIFTWDAPIAAIVRLEML